MVEEIRNEQEIKRFLELMEAQWGETMRMVCSPKKQVKGRGVVGLLYHINEHDNSTALLSVVYNNE